jgi:hypothetical protein
LSYYLFEPESILQQISAFPQISEIIRKDFERALPSSLLRYKKSKKQIFRILGNLHYDNLRNLLPILEVGLEEQLVPKKKILTSSSNEFSNFISEILIANHFKENGYKVSSPELKKEQNKTPDLLLIKGSQKTIVEIYSPNDFFKTSAYFRKVSDLLKNFDFPYHFRAKVEFYQHSDFLAGHNYETPDPWSIEKALSKTKPPSDLLKWLESNLKGQKCLLNGNFEIKKQAFYLKLTIDAQKAGKNDKLCRSIDLLPSSISGYNPEWVFENWILEKTIRKLGKNQALASDCNAGRFLFIDLTKTCINSELDCEFYLQSFISIANSKLDGRLSGYNGVAFFYFYNSIPIFQFALSESSTSFPFHFLFKM